ncbi:MAG: VTC domain-containing protein [Candidatus Pacebacteria bacterium]|nr:VTC domain-containing protein [Candidatus Paceibacterota bacterium]
MILATQERGESRGRIICDPEALPFDLNNYERVKFAEPFSHTVYLGLEDGTFPDGFAFRLRVYGEQIANKGEVGVLDLNQTCFLEIKHPVKGQPGARKKLRFQTTIKEAFELAQSVEKVKEIFGEELSEETKNNLDMFYSSNLPVVPLAGISYEREHFINGHRMTFDKNISSFSVVKYDGVYFVKFSDSEPYSLLEVKTKDSTGEANISKFRISSKQSGQAVHIEPGMNMMAEGDWLLNEIELKLDTVSDPKEVFKSLESTDEIKIGPWKDGSSLMQFLIIGKSGICIMGREGVTSKMAIKSKDDGHMENGVLVRSERVLPYTEEDLRAIAKEKGAEDLETVKRTAYFSRNRTIRLVTCADTGNVFAITADRCVSEDGRPDLFQTEIEYRGRIANVDNQIVDPDQVQRDFRKVALWLSVEFKKKKLVPTISSVTKYEWASSKPRTKLPEGIKQGNNAVLEFDSSGTVLTKKYDLWSTDDPDRVVSNFAKFRDEVSKLYKLPALIETTRTDFTYEVKEEVVQGIMGEDYLKNATDDGIVSFIRASMLPLVGQIEFGREIELDQGRVSRAPFKTPVDLKPDSFIVDGEGNLVLVDLFPPLNRDKDGLIALTYNKKPNQRENDTWVYGEAPILITRFLMRCIRPNPEKYELITRTMIECVNQLDKTGFLLDLVKENTLREKTITDFSLIKNGTKALALINTL